MRAACDAQWPPATKTALMQIYFLRHGIAIPRSHPDCPPDPERALTGEGRERTELSAHGLQRLGVDPDGVWTSPYRRARETADIVCEVLGFDPGSLRESPALEPDRDPEEIFTELAGAGCAAPLCVGHAPHLDLAISHAIHSGWGVVTQLKKAGAAALEWDPATGRGELLWLLPARALRRLGQKGPDA